jgi:enterochelin esterase-like enzyme
MKSTNLLTAAGALALMAAATLFPANTCHAQGGGKKGPPIVSPEVKSDRKVTFRIAAPKAEAVGLLSSDLPGDPKARALTKGENGVWELTVGPVDSGAYRYTFNVDGVSTIDSRNQAVSESTGRVSSVIYVAGAAFMDETKIPHGALARVHYHSSALDKSRRMHIYTPPGYENGQEKYPVFYLLHGAGDCDDSWTSVGRANFILDNLIAANKAKPMIVVMPAGHTGPFTFGGKQPNLGAAKFEDDFVKDIRPYVEKNYRVLTDRSNRAIAGLSMGGAQTLNIAIPGLKDYGYIGVFSSAATFGKTDEWEKTHQKILDDAEAKKGLKLLWLSTGTKDFLMPRTRETVEMFKKHSFNPVFKESDGGHTWTNWRNYLNEFAPQLFR